MESPTSSSVLVLVRLQTRSAQVNAKLAVGALLGCAGEAPPPPPPQAPSARTDKSQSARNQPDIEGPAQLSSSFCHPKGSARLLGPGIIERVNVAFAAKP